MFSAPLYFRGTDTANPAHSTATGIGFNGLNHMSRNPRPSSDLFRHWVKPLQNYSALKSLYDCVKLLDWWERANTLTYMWLNHFYLLSYSCVDSDGSDGAGGGGGVLPLLAPSSRCSPLGGVWNLPTEPGVFCVSGGCPLSGLQQLICQPCHLRFPVGELQKSLQAGLQVPDRDQRVPTQRH